MTDTKKLRDKIASRGLQYSFIAAEMNLSRQGLLKKIENDSEFKASEIEKMRAILNLEDKERDEIFFAS